jgi:hypothetical protein
LRSRLVIVRQRSAVRFGSEVLASLAAAAIPIGFGSASLEACSHCATSLAFVLGFSDACLCSRKLATRIVVPLLVRLALPYLLPFPSLVFRSIADLPSGGVGGGRKPGTGGCVSSRSDRIALAPL